MDRNSKYDEGGKGLPFYLEMMEMKEGLKQRKENKVKFLRHDGKMAVI